MIKFGPLNVIQATSKPVTGSVILFHGSGDTGQGFLNWIKFLVDDFSLPYVKFLFPTAPLRPYTPLNGELSNVWFNREAIRPDVPEHLSTLESTKSEILTLIQNEVSNGISIDRIVVGGFSMGGALALHTAYRYVSGLAGVFALSSFLNNESLIYKHFQTPNTTPLYMCHGDRDSLVPLEWGQKTFSHLQQLGTSGEFNVIKNAMHEIKENEIRDVLRWIQKILPEKSSL